MTRRSITTAIWSSTTRAGAEQERDATVSWLRATGWAAPGARERALPGVQDRRRISDSWRQLNASATLITLLLTGATFPDGVLVEYPARREPEVPMAA